MEIKYNVPLSKYTSYKVGGIAKIYIKPNNLSELVACLPKLPPTEKILWLGLGSNILIRDHGFNGIIIHTNNGLNDINILAQYDNGMLIKVGAGLTCAKLAKFCVKHNLLDGIWFGGIPGTIGGALSMNAGAFKGETWNHVKFVEVINRCGTIMLKYPSDYQISYRSVVNLNTAQYNFNEEFEQTNNPKVVEAHNYPAVPFNDNKYSERSEWFISAALWFTANPNTNAKNLQYNLNELLRLRKNTQPIGTLNCGSVFKNPPNNFAGKLIEGAKLKGKKIGNAIISEKHANFIINLGQATALDIENLINFTQQQVFEKYGIMLEPEVKIFGE